MDAEAARRIERLNYYLGAAAIAITAVVCDSEQLVGMIAGVVISCLNFTSLRQIITRVMQAPEGRGSRSALLFLPQIFGLMGAVAAAFFLLPASPVFVAIGFSVFMISIGVETARFAMTPVLGQP